MQRLTKLNKKVKKNNKQGSAMKDIALKLLIDRPRNITYLDIATETGLTVSWLRLFARNKIDDPGLSKIERLVKYLKANANDDQ
jgi:transcriptional regulator with XRE-family HTH domain